MPEDLPAIAKLFDDPDTQLWLGGRDWPTLGLRLQGPDRQIYLAIAGLEPVGLVDCETYPDNSASFAVVTAPDKRRQGFGRTMISALMAEPRYASITRFFVGIGRSNAASIALVQGLGFVQGAEDEDGFIYFDFSRS